MNIIDVIKELTNTSNGPKTEDSVIVTEDSVIVTVSVTPPIGDNIGIKSNYFIKELKKKIPALDKVIIHDRPISVVMKVPVVCKSGRNNTVGTINNLASMGVCIIKLILDNTSIPVRIEGIANDCMPWFDKPDENEEG